MVDNCVNGSAKTNRRLQGIVLVLVVAFPLLCLGAQRKSPGKMIQDAAPKSVTIHQEVDFRASPQQLYEALLDTKQFVAFSGRPADIHREIGGAFSLFGGHIVGRILETVPNVRIVQAWRVVDWPAGVYSIAKFEFQTHGTGTRLVFDHQGFPEALRDHLAESWEANYWALLQKYLH